MLRVLVLEEVLFDLLSEFDRTVILKDVFVLVFRVSA
jgi:hypothetical protein